MASELFSQANAEFVDENYEKALHLYSKAIEIDGEKDDYYSSRSHAYLKLERYQEAAADADKAISLNNRNTKAYIRKGIALYHMRNYEKAKEVFIDGQVRDPDDGIFIIWIEKCDLELGLTKNKETNTQEKANQNGGLETEMKNKPKEENSLTELKETTPAAAHSEKNDTTSAPLVKPLPMPIKKIYDWYQTGTHVIITVLQKNVKREDLSIDIHENSVSVTIQQSSGSDFSLELDLAHPIVPEQSLYKVMSTKIEIKLKKKEGIQWTMLEGDGQKSSIKSFCMPDPVTDVKKYPSSSHHTRNWDKVAHDVAEEEKNEKPEGDAALNQLFQKIYADASEDTKRAMVKSFYESGGTVLSTNWKEIGSKKTEVKPPDGMEFKKWQY
ncbi:hypothetical protein ACJMK2_031415 [Sinanodonta woodiana]|uniref:Suppressor of G2 allele of SKP1 n=1 Tax=Sinanodonta woodiana TaxID=1069815 RepID=A0ABD3WZ93_SINWO